MLRKVDEKITDAVKTADNHSNNANDKLEVQMTRDASIVAATYERAIALQDKVIANQADQIKALSDRLDKYLLMVVGMSITSLISVVLMLASIILKTKV